MPARKKLSDNEIVLIYRRHLEHKFTITWLAKWNNVSRQALYKRFKKIPEETKDIIKARVRYVEMVRKAQQREPSIQREVLKVKIGEFKEIEG